MMTLRESAPHLVVLAYGYLLAAVAAAGLLGAYPSFSMRPALERVLVLFMLPLAGTVIWWLVRSLQRRRLPAHGRTWPSVSGRRAR